LSSAVERLVAVIRGEGIRPPEATLLEQVASQLADKRSRVRSATIARLARLPSTPAVLSLLRRGLFDPAGNVGAAAAGALSEIGEHAVPLLLEALTAH